MRSSGYDVALASLLACMLAPSVARAGSPKADADAAFREAKHLLEMGKIGPACLKFDESERLDPAPGTRINLAVCHEMDGQLMVAESEFVVALEDARRGHRADREALAQEHLATIATRLGHLVIRAEGPVEGLSIARDGVAVPESAWGQETLLEPGPHRIEAHAPGRPAWSVVVALQAGETHAVTIPAGAWSTAPVVLTLAPPPPARTRRTAAFVVGGVGVAALGLGAAFGFLTINSRAQSVTLCPDYSCGNKQGVDDAGQARTWAHLSDAGFGVGVVALGVATVLYLTGKPAPPGATSARLGWLRLGPSGPARGAAVGGSF